MVDLVFRRHNLSYRVALEAGGWEVIQVYVEQGLGVSIVTDVCLTAQERLARIPLDRYFPKRSYGLVLRRGKFMSAQAKCFIKVIEALFANRVVEPQCQHPAAGTSAVPNLGARSVPVGAAPRRDGLAWWPAGSLRFARSRRGGAPTVFPAAVPGVALKFGIAAGTWDDAFLG